QPECAHDWHSRLTTLVYRGVKIRHQTVAQFEVLAADRLHRGIVQFAFVGIGRASGVVRDFVWPKFAGIPSPRQAKVPRSSMRTKERTERAELKPAHMQLAGVL